MKLILAGVILAAAFFEAQIMDFISNIKIDDNTPVVVVVEPDLEYKTLVKAIVATEIEGEDAEMLSAFYAELADVVKNDPGLIKTTGQFREFNMTAGGLNFAGEGVSNKYANLGEDIDEAIAAAIGKESGPLDPKRDELVECLLAISWAVKQ